MNLAAAKALMAIFGYTVVEEKTGVWVPHDDRKGAFYMIHPTQRTFTADVWKNRDGTWTGVATRGDTEVARYERIPFAFAKQKASAAMKRWAAKERVPPKVAEKHPPQDIPVTVVFAKRRGRADAKAKRKAGRPVGRGPDCTVCLKSTGEHSRVAPHANGVAHMRCIESFFKRAREARASEPEAQ